VVVVIVVVLAEIEIAAGKTLQNELTKSRWFSHRLFLF
jgi:hypothetical protein